MKRSSALIVFALCPLLVSGRCAEPPRQLRLGVALGDEGRIAARLAIDDVNAAGGIDGVPLDLRIIVASYSASAALAIAAAESLANDPTIVGVVGHSNSGATLAASQIYNARQLTHIAPTSTAPILDRAGPFTFRLVASDVHQAAFLGDAATACTERPRIAMLYVNDDYGRGLAGPLKAQLLKRGVHLVQESPVSDDDAISGDDLARSLADARPDLLLWIGREATLRAMLPAMRRRLPRIRVLASDGVEDAVATGNRDGIFTGLQYVRFIPATMNSEFARLRDRLRAALPGAELTGQALLTYDAVMLYAEVLRTGRTDRAEIQEYLEQVGGEHPPFRGLSGMIAFDSTRGTKPRYYLAEVTSAGVRTPASCTPTQ